MANFSSFQTHILTVAIIFLILAGWSVSTAPPAYACDCVVPPPPLEALEDAEHVFAGEVLEIREVGTGARLDVRIAVTEAWKGVEEQEIVVHTPSGSAACGYEFEEGKKYLAYTYMADGEIQTSLCQRNAELSAAGEDLAALGQGTPASELQAVGTQPVVDDTPEPEPAIEESPAPSPTPTEPDSVEVTAGSDIDDEQEGLDIRLLGGSLGLFLAIVMAITFLRRWR